MAIIKKKLSFVMQLDGITIKSMDDLRENPSSELLQMHKDGRLGRWLGSHHADEEREKLNDLTLTGDSVKDLAAIFEILGIDRDADDIRSSFFEETGCLGNSKSSEEVSSRLNLAYFIQSLFWMRNELSENINFIDRDYISLKITTKEYLNRVQNNKELCDDAVNNTFFLVKQIENDNILPSVYINKVIRCVFGTVNDLKSGEKHIDFPSWGYVKETTKILSSWLLCPHLNGECNVSRSNSVINNFVSIESSDYKNIKLESLLINNIHFPLRITFDPDAVLVILQQICDLCGNIKIVFKNS